MNYQDKTLTCKQCHKKFTFSVSEQAFFAERGFSDPVRCHDCRKVKKEKYVEPKEIDANVDWVAAMNAKWKQQLVLFGDKD